jgi:hypothetical protein
VADAVIAIHWQISYVVSDHSPCVSSLKSLDTGDFMHAWGGIGGLGLGLSLLYTEASKRGVDNVLGKIALWCSFLSLSQKETIVFISVLMRMGMIF